VSEPIAPISPRLEPVAEGLNGSSIKTGTARKHYRLRLGPTALIAVIAVASLVAWLCTEDASYVTGQSYIIDGGMTQQVVNVPA